MAARLATGTTRLDAAPRPARARPADQRQCRTADAGCTAACRPAPRRLKVSSAYAKPARSMVAIRRPRSPDDVQLGRLFARSARCCARWAPMAKGHVPEIQVWQLRDTR